MNRQPLDNDQSFHRITPSEVRAFNNYLPSIEKALKLAKKHFIGKIKIYVYVVNNRDVCSLPVFFRNRHFMHLCGVKYVRGANAFARDVKAQRLRLQDLYIKEDGSTFQKLEVVDKIDLLDTLNTKVSIGSNGIKLHFDNLVRTKADVIGMAVKNDKSGENFPLSLLSLPATALRRTTSFNVVAILEENPDTHKRRCAQIEENCTKKIKEEINSLLSVPKKEEPRKKLQADKSTQKSP